MTQARTKTDWRVRSTGRLGNMKTTQTTEHIYGEDRDVLKISTRGIEFTLYSRKSGVILEWDRELESQMVEVMPTAHQQAKFSLCDRNAGNMLLESVFYISPVDMLRRYELKSSWMANQKCSRWIRRLGKKLVHRRIVRKLRALQRETPTIVPILPQCPYCATPDP